MVLGTPPPGSAILGGGFRKEILRAGPLLGARRSQGPATTLGPHASLQPHDLDMTFGCAVPELYIDGLYESQWPMRTLSYGKTMTLFSVSDERQALGIWDGGKGAPHYMFHARMVVRPDVAP